MTTVAPSSAARPPDPSTSRRLVVVRHGQTEWNVAGRYQGHADIPLDEEGEAQAAALAETLADLAPDLVVSSDLQRAVRTAAPLAARAGLVPILDRRLREVDVGAWEGLTAEEALARFPVEYTAWRSGEDVVRGGGETRAAGGARAAEALCEHAERIRPGGLLVAVSHGMVLRAALEALREAGRTDLAADPPHLDNVAWLAFQLDPEPPPGESC